jgi:hypothetical protein
VNPSGQWHFVVLVHGGRRTLAGVANLGIRPIAGPSDVNGGRVLLNIVWVATETPAKRRGKIIRVELLHKLHVKYDGSGCLTQGIACDDARSLPGVTTQTNLANHARPG